ncbi:hypothetical protein Tco_0745029 [Tanacetum coccineum]
MLRHSARMAYVQEECPKNIGTDEMKNLKKTSQTPKGISVGQEVLTSVEKDVELGTNGRTSNLASQETNSSGSSFWNVESSSPSTTPIIEKIDKIEKLIIDRKVTLVDDEGKPLEKDVIENGNLFKPEAQTTTNADGTSTSQIPGPYKDAKTLFAAIQTRFGGNEATKKTQKTLLKQMYENFSAPSTESLDSIFNMLQKILSQLAILGENISQEDLNSKFLRSLSSEWNTHVVVWRNKHDLDIMSFDDLYNNFKIVEQEVKGTASSSSSSSS